MQAARGVYAPSKQRTWSSPKSLPARFLSQRSTLPMNDEEEEAPKTPEAFVAVLPGSSHDENPFDELAMYYMPFKQIGELCESRG
jgi:hypothetical protein